MQCYYKFVCPKTIFGRDLFSQKYFVQEESFSLMKECGGVPRFTLPIRVATRAGETAVHASHCRRTRVMPSRALDDDIGIMHKAHKRRTHAHRKTGIFAY